MSTDLVHTQAASPARASAREQEALIREQFGLQGATSTEIDYFFSVCERAGLDPIQKQIYAIMRYDGRAKREKLVVQVGIDGLRLAAARTNAYAGQDDAVIRGVVEGTVYPAEATVTVYKIVQGVRCPFTATARWSEYCQRGRDGSPLGQWPKMPTVMLAKCAEALALRKAFPAELGGIYSDVEMQQGDVVDASPVPLTDEQQAHLLSLSEQAGVPEAAARRRVESMRASDYAGGVAKLEQLIVERGDVVDAVEIPEGACPDCTGSGADEQAGVECATCNGTGEAG